jgi:hypothetical protein
MSAAESLIAQRIYLRLMRDPEGSEFCVEPGPVGR